MSTSYKGQGINPYKGIKIPRSTIEEAINNNPSMRQAAQSISVSYNTFKKYAKEYRLWEPKKSSAGISRARKVHWSGWNRHGMTDHLHLMDSYIREGKLISQCSVCGFDKKREKDSHKPLVPTFRDGNEQNTEIDNIRLFCYNCYFISYSNRFQTQEKYQNTVIDDDPSTKELTGDDLAKELGENLSNLFDKG
tara:strand:- start:498 stop:1076 length:579 start_codon:yes stop_codon:yes gene_type:complete